MTKSYSFMQNKVNRPCRFDDSYPAVLADEQDNLVFPSDGATVNESDWHISVFMPFYAGGGQSDSIADIATRVHVEQGIPMLLVRHQRKRETHVLVIPLLTTTVYAYLEFVRDTDALLTVKFDAAHPHLTNTSVFDIGQSLDDAIEACLDLRTHEEIATAMRHVLSFAASEYPVNLYDDLSLTSVLCVPEVVSITD